MKPTTMASTPTSQAWSLTTTAQRGLTLVELLVALVIGLLISLAAISSLVVTRQGFNAVDAASQLRDNGRFAADLIQRITLQAGYKIPLYAVTLPSQQDLTNDAAGLIASNITGFNNALVDTTDLTTAATRTSSVLGYGSDVLVLRFQGSDGSIIDCSGATSAVIPASRNERMVSVFHVALDPDGEPALMCSRSVDGVAAYTTQTLVRGVENFQVLYGVDGFTAVNTAFNPGAMDSVPERYLRADQIVVGGNTHSQATYANWRQVRSIRIGMILRGPVGSQSERVAQTLYPFGLAKDSATGTAGSALSSANDVGTIFSAPADGRLRQVVTFTIHLRTDQSL